MNEKYTARELQILFGDIKEDLTAIKAQTTKTNGRVNKLEMWRWILVGGGIVMASCVIPMFTWYAIKIDSKVEKIYETFNTYEVTIEK